MGHSIKAKILSTAMAICMFASSFAGLGSLVASAATLTPIQVIMNDAANNDASGLQDSDLLAAGVTAATERPTNLNAYKTAIAASPASSLATTAQIQALVDSVNLAEAIKLINSLAGTTSANFDTLLAAKAYATVSDALTAAGATSVISLNDAAYKTAIMAAAAGSLDTTTKIQALVTSTNSAQSVTALAAIKAAAGKSNTISANDLITAGALNVNPNNVADYEGVKGY